MASAAERPNWISVSTGVEQHNARGVPGIGTVNHCYHGSHPSTTDEIVDTLLAVAPLIGSARVVSAAPTLAGAIGYEVDTAFERG